MSYPAYRVAAAHVAPVFLDLAKTVEKAVSVIEEASRNGAQLVAFPEAFVPAFPLWSALQAPIYTHEWFKRLAASSPRCPGPELDQIAAAARRLGVFVSLGFNELSPVSVGCLWNSNVLIGDDGAILNHHRKLVPTFFEKLTWANGDGAGLRVTETRLGKLGMLICGENTNPLARYTLMAEGEQVHVSTYPPAWPRGTPAAAATTIWPAPSGSARARIPSRPRRSISSCRGSSTPPRARRWRRCRRTPVRSSTPRRGASRSSSGRRASRSAR
jgi:predicted amidohydrolase